VKTTNGKLLRKIRDVFGMNRGTRGSKC